MSAPTPTAREIYPISLEDSFTSAVLVRLAQHSGESEIRRWPLEHAAQVDAKLGDRHDFGRNVLKQVLAIALEDDPKIIPRWQAALLAYRRRRGDPLPSEDSSVPESSSIRFGSIEGIRVFSAVAAAHGINGQNRIINFSPFAPSLILDYRVPGMEYVHFATSAIMTPRSGGSRPAC